MAQVSMTVRMDSQLKKMFDELCLQFGMSANTAMNVFAKAVVQRGKIPFEIRGDRVYEALDGSLAYRSLRAMAESGQLPDLSLDEINDEINQTRQGV